MSDYYLRYVPDDPQYQPSSASAAAAEAALRMCAPQAEGVSSSFHEAVTFIDPGGNWSGVDCPACGADAEPWWGDAMSTAAVNNFTSLSTSAPCCGAKVSLNGLRYRSPAAFGRFVLEAQNPNRLQLAAQEIEQLAAILGCTLREIRTHL